MKYRQPFSGSYPITQYFGEKYTDPEGHKGIDYACPIGTPILAAEAGTVTSIGRLESGYGHYVMVRHTDGNTTLYAHLSDITVRLWATVKKGDLIGYSGNTGNSTGPHLHFEVRGPDGKAFDPMNLPLQSVVDNKPEPAAPAPSPLPPLKGADQLGEKVEVVAPNGAWAWSPNFDKRSTVYLNGQKLYFTGKTTERNGYTYCEVYPEPVKYWVAVHDNDCQILDNQK